MSEQTEINNSQVIERESHKWYLKCSFSPDPYHSFWTISL